jgi:hypothetical protein
MSSSATASDGGASEASEVSEANRASVADSVGADQANHAAWGVQGGGAQQPPARQAFQPVTSAKSQEGTQAGKRKAPTATDQGI